MKPSIVAVLAFCAFGLAGCTSTGGSDQEGANNRVTHERLHGALWVQHAAEYEAITKQIFYLAGLSFEAGLADPDWTAVLEQQDSEFSQLPPAVIVDVDETVLDNSPFQAQLVVNNIDFDPELWSEWVAKENAQPVAGALRFIQGVSATGTTVFYVTNRHVDNEAHTRRNLERWGFPLESEFDPILSKGENDWPSDKTSRRAFIAENYRVVLLLGDDINDFVSGARTKSPEPRQALVREHDSYWGRRWILLPNPLYGSWETSLIARDFSLSDSDKLQKKYSFLSPFEESVQ